MRLYAFLQEPQNTTKARSMTGGEALPTRGGRGVQYRFYAYHGDSRPRMLGVAMAERRCSAASICSCCHCLFFSVSDGDIEQAKNAVILMRTESNKVLASQSSNVDDSLLFSYDKM